MVREGASIDRRTFPRARACAATSLDLRAHLSTRREPTDILPFANCRLDLRRIGGPKGSAGERLKDRIVSEIWVHLLGDAGHESEPITIFFDAT
jgi:hypothetical protein